jgi:hypothetical protein
VGGQKNDEKKIEMQIEEKSAGKTEKKKKKKNPQN